VTGRTAVLEPEPDAGGLRPMLGRATLVGAGTIWQQGLMFATGVVVARVLGAAEYGLFNLARNLTDLAGIVTRLGLDVGLQRHFGEDPAPAARAAQAAVLARLRLLCGGLALLPALALLLGLGAALEDRVYRYPMFAETLLGLALVLPFATDLALLGGAYRGALRLGPSVLAEYVLLPALRLAVILVLFAVGWRLAGVVAGSMAATALAALVLAARARRDFAGAMRGPGAPWHDAWRVMRYSTVLSGSVLVTVLTANLDLLLLGHFGTAEETGSYALAKTLLVAMGFFGLALGQGAGALVAERCARGDPGAAAGVLALTTRWIALGTAPVLALFLFWGLDLTRLFGSSFEVPAAVLACLAATQYGVALLGPAGWALSMTGRHSAEFAMLAAGLAVAAVTGALAIPVFGAMGAAAATAAAIAVGSGGRLLLARRALGRLPLSAGVLPITAFALAAAAAAAWLADWLPWPQPARAAAGASGFVLAYAALAWMLLLREDERGQLRAFATRRGRGRA
jgi:O-antigen/teichoic acid export membrane protein